MSKIIGATIGTALIAGTLIIGYLDYNTSKYVCNKCGKEYRPTPIRWVAGVHTPAHRHMKCPQCGEWGWHKRIFDWDLDASDYAD